MDLDNQEFWKLDEQLKEHHSRPAIRGGAERVIPNRLSKMRQTLVQLSPWTQARGVHLQLYLVLGTESIITFFRGIILPLIFLAILAIVTLDLGLLLPLGWGWRQTERMKPQMVSWGTNPYFGFWLFWVSNEHHTDRWYT